MASILRVNTLTDASSNNSIATSNIFSGTAKCWGGANTAAVIKDSFNIASSTDDGTGQYTITLTNSMNTDDNAYLYSFYLLMLVAQQTKEQVNILILLATT